MTRKIGIIGLGHVGATWPTAWFLVKHTCDHLVLIDTNEKKVKADALDSVIQLPIRVSGSAVNDYAALKMRMSCQTLGNIELQANNTDDRFAELPLLASKWCK